MQLLIKYFLPCILGLFSGVSNAQNWIWANHTVKGSGNNYALDVSLDNQNNYFITGRVKSTATIGTGTSGMVVTPYGDRDIYVAKYGNDSSFKWATHMGGTLSDYGYGIDNDGLGNTYVTGHFTSSATFQSFSLTSFGSSDFFLTKLDSLGNIIWVSQQGGTSADGAYGISTLNSGVSYVVGSFFGTTVFGNDTLVSNGLDDIFVAKFDSSGTCLWAVSFGGADNDVGFGIDADENGNIYFTGYFTATVNFGSVVLTSTSAGNADIVTARLDDSGTVIWAKKSGSGIADQGNNLVADNLGNVHVVGNWAQTTITVLKYDSSGNLLWQIFQGGPGFDTGNDIDIDTDYNVFVTGYFSSTVNFSGIPLTATGGDDIFIEKFDSSGVIQWARKQGGNANDHSFGLKVNNNNEILIAGAFEGTVDFDGTTFSAVAVYDAFLGKLSEPLNAVFFANDTTICQGASVYFQDGSAGHITSYSWNFPGGNPSSSTSQNPVVNYIFPGSYDVTLAVSDGISSDTTTLAAYITVYGLPSVDLGNDTTVCSGSSFQLDAGIFSSYSWSTGDSVQVIIPQIPGQYSVSVIDVNGCTAFDTVSVTIINTILVNLGPDTVICDTTSSIILDAGQGFATYLWSQGDTTQQVSVFSPGNYFVTVADSNSCSSTDTIAVIFENCLSQIELYSENKWEIYPNPANDYFDLYTSSKQAVAAIKILTVSGQTVFSKELTAQVTRVSTLFLPGGVYFLQIIDEESVRVIKVLISK